MSPTPIDPEYTDRHPIWGLPARLIIDGSPFWYDSYLDCWTNGLGVELTGRTIMLGMSLRTRVEVAR
ncbi:hypothetical protein [Microbacterium sp. Ag1]|uniref:hypothetical protein n=1 Tax=Microbacterium sp. Ag1 TaxID=1643443 RepID=UPI0006290FA8|nr:hypothetical protein [Microbacterium sp. Ag1]KKX97196.1 hypothetical protein AAY78_14560 [Microbacterium sp. Ag1]